MTFNYARFFGLVRLVFGVLSGGLMSTPHWSTQMSGAILAALTGVWTWIAHHRFQLGTLTMNFSQLLASVAAILSHPDTVVPAELAPQADAVKAVATAGVGAVEGLGAGLLAHESDSLLSHNKHTLGAFLPYASMAVAVFDQLAVAWVANKTGVAPTLPAAPSSPVGQ